METTPDYEEESGRNFAGEEEVPSFFTPPFSSSSSSVFVASFPSEEEENANWPEKREKREETRWLSALQQKVESSPMKRR